MQRKQQTTELPDSFDPLLRAAVDVSDVPPDPRSAASVLLDGTELSGGRFRIARLIGSGGMGSVYEAEDRDAGERVALKVLRRLDSRAVKRFKDEFRLLADVVHPHLVRLHDLFVEGETWFFTMDLVEGGTLALHLEGAGPPGSAARESEIRRLLPQLIDGVTAIHSTDNVHRDLKPANVLVSEGGRLTIVDFGLVGDLPGAGRDGALPVAGTASHMAPEQARGEPATPASDWYAVGTILYEALTGRAPFAGSASEVLRQKATGSAPRLFEGEGFWPDDLVALCRQLLSPEPARRATGHDVKPRAAREPSFAGRTRELEELHRALSRAQSGTLAVCRIVGPPGMGKTALVREFLRREAGKGAKALTGRCRERETTPFKLLEGLVDSLSEAVARHAPSASPTLLPLASLFLGLSREGTPQVDGGTTGPELRGRAVSAFRDGLAALARTGPVVVHVDDVQWCDADGVGLLEEILEVPVPALTLVFTARDDEPTDAVRALWNARFWRHAETVDLRVGKLEHDETVAIVREMTRSDPDLDADAIALECEGNPYFAAEIVRHALEQRHAGEARTSVAPTLGGTILSRYRNLPDGAHRVLSTLAVADGPRSVLLLKAATGVADLQRSVAILRASSFVRTHATRSTVLVEPYHDRVREEVHRALPESERRALHLASARAFEALAPGASEQLLHHYDGAAVPDAAARYARKSAERAAQAHAFEQAAALYRRALQCAPWEVDDETLLHERLAEALAMCGHGAEAADSYDRAARMASRAHRVRLEMLAGSQMLCSGNVTLGLERLFQNIGYVGVEMATGDEAVMRTMANVSMALAEAQGVDFREEGDAGLESLLRVDACWWAVKGVSSVHHASGPFLGSAHLLEAVRAGEPMRIARGAYTQAAALSAPQWESLEPVVAGLMQLGDDATARAPGPNVRFWRDYSLVWQSHFAFDVDGVGAHVASAREHARSGGSGLEAELAMMSILEEEVLIARFQDPAELGRYDIWKRDAIRRGDRSLAAWMSVLDSKWWQTETPETRRTDLLTVLDDLSAMSDEGHVLAWVVHSMLAWAERYLGMLDEASARMHSVLGRVRESPLWIVPRHRIFFGQEYLACAIASAEAKGTPVPVEAQALLDELPAKACGVIDVFRAAIAHLAGEHREAVRLLDRAEAAPGQERVRVVGIGTRTGRALVTGNRAVVEEEFASLRHFGAADPLRLFVSWWPGFGA